MADWYYKPIHEFQLGSLQDYEEMRTYWGRTDKGMRAMGYLKPPSDAQINTAKQKIKDDAAAKVKAEADAKLAAETKIKTDNLAQGTANINDAFASYDDNYYDGITKKYLDYYLPQVDDQYQKSGEQLLYNLSRNGIFDSSAKTDAYADADKIYGEQKQDITSKANKFSSDARTYISDQKNALTGQLNFTGGDPLQASGFLGKAPAAISVTAPTAPNFSPLANLFDNITSIAKNETNAAMLSNQYGGGGGYAGSFNKPLKSRGSSKFAD